MHKFVGGVQSPGVLVAKKQLFTNAAPHVQGGGTVFFVTDTDHRYVKEVPVNTVFDTRYKFFVN
jgi:selenocysteine lyase/cysteine desulfurase